jgi:hypothetical protein
MVSKRKTLPLPGCIQIVIGLNNAPQFYACATPKQVILIRKQNRVTRCPVVPTNTK